MVPVDDQGLAVKRRGTALAVPMLGMHFAEVLFPEQLAVRVQTVETARTEKREHMLAIRDGRCRRQAGSLMTRFVRQFLVHRLLPENLAALAANRQHRELVVVGHSQVVMGARTIGEAGP